MRVDYPLNTLLTTVIIWLCGVSSILCDITINEISCGTGTDSDMKAFVELRTSADYVVSNNSFMLNVYDKDSEIVSSNTFNLTEDSYQLILIAANSSTPSADILVSNGAWLTCDSDFVVLYQLAANQIAPANTDIIDAVVYNGSSKINVDMDLAKYLLSTRKVVTLPDTGSLGRCGKMFSALTKTPRLANGCPVPSIIINEINADNPGTDDKEYIELFDGGGGNTHLDGLLVVFYSGNGIDNKAIYKPLSLNGYQTHADGYFVIAHATVDNVDLVINNPSHWIQNGPDAIVLHYGKEADFPRYAMASNNSVVDVVVYGTNDEPSADLLSIFTPGQMQVNEDFKHNITGDEAIMRCFSNDAVSLASFIIGHHLSPGKRNICPAPPLVINEVYLDDNNATKQFIEISSNGVPKFPLQNMVVVLYKGDNTSVAAIAVDNVSTDVNGLRVVTSIPKVTVADVKSILLYIGSATDFPDASVLDSAKAVHSLMGVDQFSEDDMSVSRCVNGNETILKTTTPTPGTSNTCFTPTTVPSTTAPPTTTPGIPVVVTSKVYINELNADTPSFDTHEFIELKGPSNTSLNGTVLVFYNGATNTVYRYIPLDGYSTHTNGFFVIGSAEVPEADITQPNNFVQNGPDAVVYYQLPVDRFKGAVPEPITEGVIDFIIYSKTTTVATKLLAAFAPGQTQILEAGYYFNSDHSISRCQDAVKDLSAFILAAPTPGADNNCTVPSVFVNEVNIGVNESFYVELYTPANSSFDGLVVVFYIESDGDITPYPISLRNKFSLSGGYFLIGGGGTNAVESESEIRYTFKKLHLLMEPATAIAIALFQGVSSLFKEPTVPPNARLLDFILLGDSSAILTNLNRSQIVVPLTGLELKSGNSSVGWCRSCGTAGSLVVAMPTPRETNDCSACNASTTQPSTEAASTNQASTAPNTEPNTEPTATPIQGIIFNEIVVSNNISEEFIELKGDPNTALDDYTLVFYKSGTKASIWDLPLKDRKIDPNGLFVLTTNMLDQTSPAVKKGFLGLDDNAVAAIVLYRGNPGPFVIDTTDSTNINDFIVYTITEAVDSSSNLPSLLFPNGNVKPIVVSSGESVSRCLGNSPKDYTAFVISMRSPGQANDCSLPKLFINEISPTENATFDFIELRAEKATVLPLTSLFLRVFNGVDGTSSSTVNLMNMKTNSEGFFWVSTTKSGSPDSVIKPPVNHFPMPSGGVALYQGNPIASSSTPPTLIDAVLYGQPDIPILMSKLPPNQGQIILTDDAKYGRQSISRCSWCSPKMQASFLLTSRTPGASNDCTIVKKLPRLVINELSTSTQQFIELKGDNNTDVSDYKVILFKSDTKPYETLELSCLKTDDKGFILIAPKSNTKAQIELKTNLVADLAAIALYDGRIRVDSTLSDVGIVDALVYGSSYKNSSMIDVLTPHSTMFVLDVNVFAPKQYAISRCMNDYKRNSTMYVVSTPTPAEENACNLDISTMIQLKLDTADCNQFNENSYESMTSILDAIVRGVNNYCKCGLSRLYFKDSKLHCGSVIYESTMISSSQQYLDMMITSYKKYIRTGPNLTVNNKEYMVNSSCYDDCYVDVKPTTGTTKSNSQVTVTIAVIVTVLVVFGLIVIFVVIYIRRKRKGILHFRLARFDNNDEDFVDFDETTGSENASFSNPLYSKN